MKKSVFAVSGIAAVQKLLLNIEFQKILYYEVFVKALKLEKGGLRSVDKM